MKLDVSFLEPLKNEILDKKNYLIQSFALHILVIFIFYYGIPDLFKYRSEFLPPLPVEIINISDKTASPKINFKSNEKKDETKDNIYKDSKQEIYNEDKNITDNQEVVQLKEIKPKKVEKKKVINEVKEIKTKPNQLQSVLRSIDQIKEDITEKKNKKDKKKSESKSEKQEATPKKLGMTLTISEEDAIRRHFEKCWNVPSGAREAGNLAAEIKVRFNKEGNVLDAKILNISRLKRDPYFRTAAESALRAVLNPRCRNAPLPLDKYDKWKNVTLNFDPKNIIGY